MYVDIFSTSRRYSIIYADPPWSYKTWSGKGKEKKSAENHYPVMSKEDIQSLPIERICADDCVLFLWVTFPCLEEGLELIRVWGFKYKTCGFTWVKRNRKSDTWFWGLALPIAVLVTVIAEIFALCVKKLPKSFLTELLYTLSAIALLCLGL